MSTLSIASGVVMYEDAVKKPVPDTEPQYFPTKRARVELTFVVPDETDGEAALDNAINLASRKVNQMLSGFSPTTVEVLSPQSPAAPAASGEPSPKRTRGPNKKSTSPPPTQDTGSDTPTGAEVTGSAGAPQTTVADPLAIPDEDLGEQHTVQTAEAGSDIDMSASVTTASSATQAATPGQSGSSGQSSGGDAAADATVVDDWELPPEISDAELAAHVQAKNKDMGSEAGTQAIRELIGSFNRDKAQVFVLRQIRQADRPDFLAKLKALA